MEIRTKDGIVLKGVPEGTPEAEIRARIDSIRAGNTNASPIENKRATEGQMVTGKIGKAGEITPDPIYSKVVDPKSLELSFAEKAAQKGMGALEGLQNVADKIPIVASPLSAFRVGKDGFSDELVDASNNIASGATSMNRGIGNLVAGKGTFKPKDSPTGNPVDKSSMSYLAGQVADPTAWATMSGMNKLPVVGKALELQKIAGKGKLLQIGKNALRASPIGAVLGGLSEDGTAIGGAIGGAITGGALPVLAAGGRAIAKSGRNFLDTIGTSFGKEGATKRMTKEAITRVAGDSRDKIVDALNKSNLDKINKVGSSTIPGYKQTVAEIIAKPQIGKEGQFGGAAVRLQKDLTGASSVEDALTGTVRSQNVAMLDYTKGLNKTTAPMREVALSNANKNGGVDVTGLVNNIDNMRKSAGMSKLAEKSLKAVKKDILSKATNGKIDANDLYTLRKEIGNTIKTYSKSTQNWDKKVTGGLERDIQKQMDDAIEASGGTGWKKYLDTFSSGKKTVSDAIAAQKEAKLIGSGVKSSLSENVKSGQLPNLPTLLSRPMMAVNYALKMVSDDATKPIEKEIVKSLQNPDLFAQYLKEPASSPFRKKAEEVVTKAILIQRAQQAQQQGGE